MPGVKVQKLESTDAFIVFDLDDAPHSIGVARLAPKILVDGATLLARSTTYLFATFEQQAGGASAGINVKAGDDRDAAIAAFVAEVAPLVEAGTFLPEPGKGLAAEHFAPLRAVDPRTGFDPAAARALVGVSAAAAAARAGGLDGRRVAIEGIDASAAPIIREVTAGGGRIVAVGSAKGSAADPGGFDPDALAAAVSERGADAIEGLGGEQGAVPAVFAADADVVFAGSKVGVIDHDVAATITATTVVPTGPVPVTAKALAVLRRAGIVVVPDFVSTCGPVFAMFPEAGATTDQIRDIVVEQVDAVLDEVLAHDDGPLLGACYRAEAFLGTWQDTLPFGRPLA